VFEDLLRRGIDADLAVLGTDSVLKQMGVAAEHASLAEPLLSYARSIPAADRTGGAFGRAVELGRKVAAGLPSDEEARIVRGFDLLLPKRLEITAVEGAMRFDVEEFTVEPGREVEIVFRNPDVMPHNVVVTAPGSAEKVGRAADAMAADADAYARNFVPDVPEVLFATPLVSPAERVTLSFQAPDAPGEYPFICSFPGHWITMRGVMKVAGESAP
jgi:azurin